MNNLDKVLKREKIIIIGNGVAGNSAAETIRALNPFARITIISRERNNFYSACALPDYISNKLERKNVFIKNKHKYQSEKIDLILGEEVRNIEYRSKTIYTKKGKVFFYDKLIIASGSHPFIPPIKGINLPGVNAFKYLWNADKLINKKERKKIVVIGGGAVGIELLLSMKKRGNIVYLIEVTPTLMPNIFDAGFANYLKKIVEKYGVKVFTSTKLVSIEGENRVEKVITDKITIPCDLVILAIGMKPEVEFAKKSGIKIGKLGAIKVNSKMLTNIKDVYACGDCVEIFDKEKSCTRNDMLWPIAKLQGKIAAFNCCGINKIYQSDINILVLNIEENQFISLGDVFCEKENNFLEKKKEHYWWKMIFSKDKAVGAQIVNNIEIARLLYILIKKELSKKECQSILNEPFIRSPVIFSKELILQKMEKVI